ncbi:MAG: histidine phosphatase family protein [Spirochaetes bacterium]|nr:histidine phosphatase family protein [Spirochaetota bacterium]
MKTVCFVRHGASEKVKDTNTDYSRHLTDKGIKETKRMAGSIVDETDLKWDAIISSGELRAVESAYIYAHKMGFKKNDVIIDEYLCHNINPDTFKKLFSGLDSAYNNIFIIGDNPVISRFVNIIFPDFGHEIPLSAVLCVESDADNWSDIFKCSCNLKFYKFLTSSKLTKLDKKVKWNILNKFDEEVNMLLAESREGILFSDISKIKRDKKRFFAKFINQAQVITINDIKMISQLQEDLETEFLEKIDKKIMKAKKKEELSKLKYEKKIIKLQSKKIELEKKSTAKTENTDAPVSVNSITKPD